MKEHLEQISVLLEEIRIHHAGIPSMAIAISLSWVKHTLEKLDHLVQTKLIRNVHGTPQARQGAWTRNKSKVHRLKTELKDKIASLTAALSASSA